MLRDLIIAGARTGCAAAAGFTITWLVGLGVQVPADFQATLTVVVFGLVVAGYNVAVGLLERRVHPLFGVLLGVPRAPAYPQTPKGDAGVTAVEVCFFVIAACVVLLTLSALGVAFD